MTSTGRESRIIDLLEQDIEQLTCHRVTKLSRWMWAADMLEAIRYIRQLEKVIRKFERLVDKRKYREELLKMDYGYDRRLEANRLLRQFEKKQREASKMTKSIALILALLLPVAANATPITIQPTDTMVFSFVTNPGNWDPSDPPDYLEFYLGDAMSGGDYTMGSTVSLYDGQTLLGQRTGAGIGAVFQGAGMEIRRDWVGRTMDTADFSSFVDGTIEGRLEMRAGSVFTFDSDKMDLRHYSPNIIGTHPIMLYDSTPLGGFWVAQGDFDWITVTSVAVRPMVETVLTPVPEPATGLMLAVGCLMAYRRRRG